MVSGVPPPCLESLNQNVGSFVWSLGPYATAHAQTPLKLRFQSKTSKCGPPKPEEPRTTHNPNLVMWYTPGPERAYYIMSLGPVYVLQWYLEPCGM